MEIKQTFRYARSLIEASLDPLVTISKEGKIMDANEAMTKITGVHRPKLIGTFFFNYFTDPEKAKCIYKEVFEKGFVTNYPLTIRDHKLTDVLYNGSLFKDSNGIVLGAVVVARDISEHKKFERDLMEAKLNAELLTINAENAQHRAEHATEIAEDAVKSKQQFLSNMSHEIRTPMNAIIGFTRVLLKTELTDKQSEFLTAIKTSGDALILLINDILDLAKVDAGKMTFESQIFKLQTSITNIVNLFENKIKEMDLSLELSFDNSIPNYIVGDPIRLHQILVNLISNAIKFTKKGKINIDIKLLSEDDFKVVIQFKVNDTGIGISKDKLSSIFENFQQATKGTSRIYGGTGLGLAIVKQLVESQGGAIEVSSKIDVGSSFSFTLNFLKTNEVVNEENTLFKLDEAIKNVKILVVEDIELNQLLMKTILDDFEFECDIASNGKIAIDKMVNKQYDLILMDIQMPIMNGFEATKYIREILKLKTPIIALTADVTTIDINKCKEAGMDDYISKPVDEQILYGKMTELLRQNSIKMTVKEQTNSAGIKRCIDLSYLMKRTKSNTRLMLEIMNIYVEQTPTLVDSMLKSLEEKNWDGLKMTVHKMIPSFEIMGINNSFEEMARKVHQYAAIMEQESIMHDLVNQLAAICTQACVEIKEEMHTIKNSPDER
jgi:PAS domain S-box-containing protein